MGIRSEIPNKYINEMVYEITKIAYAMVHTVGVALARHL